MTKQATPAPSAFAQAFAAEPARLAGPKCTILLILDGMTADDRADFTAALADPMITAARISRILARLGHKVTGQTVQRHRHRGCGCPE